VNLYLATGTVDLQFEDNTSLLYQIDFATSNRTVQQTIEPEATYNNATKRVNFAYSVGTLNVTLGTSVNYTISIETIAGSIDVQISHGTVNNITLEASTGSIDLTLTSNTIIDGKAVFDLTTGTGSINTNIAMPTGVEGSFEGTTGLGSVNIVAPSWTEITSEHYETSGYATATTRISVIAETTTGSINANLL
jgi:hypothetical protein